MREYRIQEAPSSRKNRVGAHVWVDSDGRIAAYNDRCPPPDMSGLRCADCGAGDITAGAYLLCPVEPYLEGRVGERVQRYSYAVHITASTGSAARMHFCETQEEAFALARTLVGGDTPKARIMLLVGDVTAVTSIQETRYRR